MVIPGKIMFFTWIAPYCGVACYQLIIFVQPVAEGSATSPFNLSFVSKHVAESVPDLGIRSFVSVWDRLTYVKTLLRQSLVFGYGLNNSLKQDDMTAWPILAAAKGPKAGDEEVERPPGTFNRNG
jgi:hypothetical protein